MIFLKKLLTWAILLTMLTTPGTPPDTADSQDDIPVIVTYAPPTDEPTPTPY